MKKPRCCGGKKGKSGCGPRGGCRIGGCTKGLIGVGIGLLLTHPVADPYPVRWALGFFAIAIISHICIFKHCPLKK